MKLDACESVAVPTVIIGEDKSLTIKLVESKTQDPFDLTSATEIVACFLNADGTVLQKALSTSGVVIISGVAGKIQVILSKTETLLLTPSPLGGLSDIELRITIGGKLNIVQLPGVISVVKKLFPTV
jgi:hypothetical protein